MDAVTTSIRSHAKQNRPQLVWGLLFGQHDLAPVVYEVAHCTNCASDRQSNIAIDDAEVTYYLRAAQQTPYRLLGYYVASNGTASAHTLDQLPLPSLYYALDLAQANGRLEWRVAQIIRGTQTRSVLKLKYGTPTQIEHRVTQMEHTRKRAASIPDLVPTSTAALASMATSQQDQAGPQERPSTSWIERLYQWVKAFLIGFKQSDSRTREHSRSSNDRSTRGTAVVRGAAPHPEPAPPQLTSPPSSPTLARAGDRKRLRTTATPSSPRKPAPLTQAARSQQWPVPQVPPVTVASPPAHSVPPSVPRTTSSRQRRIIKVCQERDITTLLHFTRLSNLNAILEVGLKPRNELVRHGMHAAVFNDPQRNDDSTNAVCLSISFPNYKTLYYWKQRYAGPWVVLGLDARILWKLDCAFCTANASSAAVCKIPIDTRRQPRFLEAMFDNVQDKGYVVDRAELALPKQYPTHPQAEVLVFGTIPPAYIKAIFFETSTDVQQYQSRTPFSAWAAKMSVHPSYFRYRSDYRFWQRQR